MHLNIFATLISLRKLAENHYEATFTYNQHDYIKCFTVVESNGSETISVDDKDLDPQLHLNSGTRRALFAFHRAFKEMSPVEKRSELYMAALRAPDNLTRIEKEKASLLLQMLELKNQKHIPQMPLEDTKKKEYESKKFIADPGTDIDILHHPLA